MSIRIMSQVWGLDLPDSEMLIMLALADWSNDDGECWPSIAAIAKKTRKGERTIQGAIKSMAAAGHLTRNENPGKGCFYRLHPRSDCTPAATAPRSHRTPAKSAPPQPLPNTPAAAAPNTSGTTNPSSEASPPSKARAKKSSIKPFRLPEGWKPARCADGTVAREIIDRRGQDWARAALESFHDWAVNAKDEDGQGRKVDWQRAWAKWVKEQDLRDGRRGTGIGMGGSGQSRTGSRTLDAALDFVADGGCH